MKAFHAGLKLRTAVTLLLLMFVQGITWAQDGSSASSSSRTVTTTTTQTTWFSHPWVWVVGGIVAILLLIALLRGGGRTERVTVTKTTNAD